ncbi:MAG TPA: head-tail adaptor protein [Rhodospirillales bacterium]|nr:head-tail adaptor protein [Rhodospirillales bacterium]
MTDVAKKSVYSMAPAGQLNKRLHLQERTVSVDASKHQTTSYADRGTVWGKVEPLAGREFFEAQTMKNEVTHRIVIRYRSDVTPRHRLIFRARTFAIVSATNSGELGMDHVCMCKEIV